MGEEIKDKKKKQEKRKSRSNIRVNYARLQSVLIYVVCGLIVAVSLFSIIFNVVNLSTTKAKIE